RERRVTYWVDGTARELFRGTPGIQTVIAPFSLSRTSCELTLQEGESVTSVPIRVVNMPQLVAEEPEQTLTFAELVSLHAGGAIRTRVEDELDIEDEEGTSASWEALSPPQAFRALQTLVGQLLQAGLSTGAFDVALYGPVGVYAIAQSL